jgi:hypothetical protein
MRPGLPNPVALASCRRMVLGVDQYVLIRVRRHVRSSTYFYAADAKYRLW